MISREDIELVKSRADIADIISRSGVTLKSAGVGSMKGLCPFHDEKGPSFTVRPNNGTYKCFGCGEGGDVFTYLMNKEGLTFTDAVHYIADMYNVTITETDSEEETGPSKRRLHEALSIAAKFYGAAYKALPETHPAKVELSKRDLGQYADDVGVGYAPEGWTHLHDHLVEKGFTEEDMLACGLANKAESGRVYDFFRGRLTWQIRDVSGKVIGFGARKLFETDNAGKYLNPMQSVVYDKSRVLYGIDMARAAAAKTKTLYIVEGYTDVMAYRAVGIENVVATCGTAFGDGHAGVARRLIGEGGRLIFGFDGDAAGRNAARKVFSLTSPIHTSSSVVIARDGDPDDIRQKYGEDALRAMIADTVSLTEFVLRDELAQHDVSTPEGRAAFLNEAAPLLGKITDFSLREDYIRKVTLWSGSTLDIVRAQMSGRAQAPEQSSGGEQEPARRRDEPALIGRQKSILAMFLQFPDATQEVSKSLEYEFFDDTLQPTATEITACLQAIGPEVAHMPPTEFTDSELANDLMYLPFPLVERMKTPQQREDYIKRTLETLIKTVRSLRSKESANALRASISASYGDKSSDDADVLRDIAARQQLVREERRANRRRV